eukprot:gene845-390_t
MSRSTIANPTGNLNGPEHPLAEAVAQDARYGIVGFDGGTPASPADPCAFAKSFTKSFAIEDAARLVKAVDNTTHVWGYINMQVQLGLSRNPFDCPLMFDPAYAGFWLRNRTSGQ